MEVLFELAKTVAVFAAIFGIWIVVQTYVRRQSGCRGDKDPLDYMPHGCANCTRAKSGLCRRSVPKQEEDPHHELA